MSPSPTSLRRRDIFAGIRILLSLLALVATLAWSWPYMYLERRPDDPLRGAEAWTNRASLTFAEVVEKLPREPAWLIVPVVVIGLAVWEWCEARLRRGDERPRSRTGVIARLFLFLVIVFVIFLYTFLVDLAHQWSDGPAKELVYTSGGLGLAGVLMDMVAVNRELAAAAVRKA